MRRKKEPKIKKKIFFSNEKLLERKVWEGEEQEIIIDS